jgi:Ser/Thr protein kinase RdoA (MazF antagonist)
LRSNSPRHEAHARRRSISYSTLSIQRVKQLFCEYGFEEPVEAALFFRGVSDTYVLSTSKRKFALKMYRVGWRSRDAITAEIAAIQHAASKGVSVAMPIARPDGGWITNVRAPEGARLAILLPWANGEPPRYTNASHATAFGSMVARLHLAGDDFHRYEARPRIDMNWLLRGPIECIKSRLHHLPSVAARLEKLRERIETRLQQVQGNLPDWGFCHGDVWQGNARIDEHTLTLFDFDLFGPGWRGFDLATYRWHARLHGAEEPAWGAFLQGYLRVRPAGADSLPHIDLLMMVRHLWTKAHLINLTSDFGVAMLTDDFLEDSVLFCEKLAAERGSPVP